MKHPSANYRTFFRLPALQVGLLLVATLALSACTTPRKVPPCPNIFALANTRNIEQFKDQIGRDAKDVDFRISLDEWKGSCEFKPREDDAAKSADWDVNIEMSIAFTATRGPANKSGTATVQYFVAIPYYYPSSAGKAVFPLSITFPPGVDTVHVTDGPLAMTIPMKNSDVIDNYTIYLGFQETAEQMERNRRGR